MKKVRCPICLGFVEWPHPDFADLYEYATNTAAYVPVSAEIMDAFRYDDDDPERIRFQAWLPTKYLRCPNPYSDPEHYLPYPYGWYGDPLIIGIVGDTDVGKSHLLAAMIGQLIEQNRLSDLGLSVVPVDRVRHQEYVRTQVAPLLSRSEVLDFTPPRPDTPATFIDAAIVTNQWTGSYRTIAFFDISGEDISQGRRSAEFFHAANSLIFVVDPEKSGLAGGEKKTFGDPAFAAVLHQLNQPRRDWDNTGLLTVDAAVVVNKSDKIRFNPPVRYWYPRERSGDRINADDVLAESRDVYALLHKHEAWTCLAPVMECQRVTLHFASATGTDKAADGVRYLHTVRPRRVLEPLVAILAMAGIIDHHSITGQTGEVGV